MKKVLLIGAIALFGAMNAQMEKGSWIVGGSTTLGFNNVSTTVSVGNNSSDQPEVSTFSVTPSVAYFVADKIAVGLDLSYTSLTQKDGDSKVTLSSATIMPTGTYYFKSASKIIPYLGAGIGYASVKTTETYKGDSDSYTVDGFAWKAKGGILYLINQNIGVDLGLGYNQFTNKETISGTERKTTVSTLGVNAGFSVFFK